jgi:hypothetical protein
MRPSGAIKTNEGTYLLPPSDEMVLQDWESWPRLCLYHATVARFLFTADKHSLGCWDLLLSSPC